MSDNGADETRIMTVHQQQQQPPLSPSSYQSGMATRRPVVIRREYRGGFTSSICDLFHSSQDRSSCCALVCCGIFLQDRNRYALDGTVPLNWSLRLVVSVLVLVILLIFLPKLGALLLIPIVLVFICGTTRRAQMRQKIRDLLVGPNDPTNTPNSAYEFCSENRRAHRCMACIPVDVFQRVELPADNTSEEFANDNQQPYSASNNYDRSKDKDSCYYVWRCLAYSCCGCCGCWFNFCGMCATAQEHRELRRLLPAEKFEVDYITLQPYLEYFPALETLRQDHSMSMWQHSKALSKLSAQLLRFLFISLLILLVASAFHLFKHFGAANVLVIVATLAQAFLVLYVVHWQNHRLDLSLDAVIKLFSSGFVLSTAIAMVVELIVGMVGGFLFQLAFAAEYMNDNPETDFSDKSQQQPTDEEIMYDIYKNHLPTLLAFLFFQSFFVAGLVEETSKYFCWWMVEHPDYIPPIMNGSSSSSSPSPPIPMVPRSIHSRAAAITVGMVATAAGFACCENLLYCLQAGSNYKSELGLLILRSLLPVHPIAAAIQSIGIVRRDIEGDGCELGRALLPAILLHGLFDFAVMTMSMMATYSAGPPSETTNTDDYSSYANDSSQDQSLLSALMPLMIGFGIMLLGVFYYMIAAYQQRQRLSTMEATNAAAALGRGAESSNLFPNGARGDVSNNNSTGNFDDDDDDDDNVFTIA